MPGSADATIALSIHGPAGVLDLVVPAGATAVDVAREYAKQAGRRRPGIPLLQTALGERLNAAPPAGRGRGPGRATCWSPPPACTAPARSTLLDAAKNAPETPALAVDDRDGRGGRRRARRLVRRPRGRGDRPHRHRRDPAGVRAGRRAPRRPARPPAGRGRSGLRRRRRLRRPLRARRPPAARDPRRRPGSPPPSSPASVARWPWRGDETQHGVDRRAA